MCISACKKSLEESPYSSLSNTQVFTDEAGLKKATLGIYSGFTNAPWTTAYRFYFGECGQQYSAGAIFGNYLAELDEFVETPTSPTAGALDAVWQQDFNVISRANTVIANANSAVSDTSIANKYIGEAKFLRAYTYFDLVRNFGGVPIIDQEINSLTQTTLIYGKRATIQQTYDFIVSDLISASSKLPNQWTGADVGRVNAGTALAMLGKVYLTMAGKPLVASGYYQKAVAVLQEVIGSANEAKYGFALQTNFPDIFSINNKRNSEIMVDFSTFYSSSNTTASLYPFFLLPRGIATGQEATLVAATYKYYQLFGAGDTRRDFTVVDRYKFVGTGSGVNQGDSIIYNPVSWRYVDTVTHTIIGAATLNSGIAYGKVDRTAPPAGAFSYPVDYVPFRFADAILCLAEAEIESGDPADGLVLINRVRARAGASLYTDDTNMEARIRLERRLELGGEFNTVYDIRRWGTLQSEIGNMVPQQIGNNVVGTYNAKYELYPIPQSEININPNLTQNPGY